jgi:hypothetical protein
MAKLRAWIVRFRKGGYVYLHEVRDHTWPRRAHVPCAKELGMKRSNPVQNRQNRDRRRARARFYSIKFGNLFSPVTRFIIRLRLIRWEQPKRIAAEQAYDAVKVLALRCQNNSYADTYILANASLFMLQVERDILSLKVECLTAHDRWTRRLNIRVLILLVFEWKVDKVFGRDFQGAITRLGVSEPLVEQFTQSLRTYRRTHEIVQRSLKTYRLETIAHRHDDAIMFDRHIALLNERRVIDQVTSLYPHVSNIFDCLTQILREVGNTEGLRKAATLIER